MASRTARVVRDNPGKSLVILGMVAMVAIVTIVVLALPSPSADVDVSGLLRQENVAGAAYAIPPFGFSKPSVQNQYTSRQDQVDPKQAYPVSMDAGSSINPSRSDIK